MARMIERQLAAMLTSVLVIAASGCGSSTSSHSASAAGHSASGPAAGELGISGRDVDAYFRAVAKTLGRRVPLHGVAVEQFVGHPPAQTAGLTDSSAHQNAVQDADIIETMDGRPVTAKELDGPLAGHHAGDVVTLRIWPARGAPHDLRASLAAVPNAPQGTGYFPGG
jgi:hypothetical protein